MRHLFSLSLIFLASLTAPAASLKVVVSDPNHAAVEAARVTLFRNDGSTVALGSTSATGIALLERIAAGNYQLEVLAAGFAAQRSPVAASGNSTITLPVMLGISPRSETVVVTGLETPARISETGAPASLLNREALEVSQSVSASEALRFLPGAVINTGGRRGGQSSLFVRGGESRYNKVIVDEVPVNDPGGTFDFGVIPLTGMERIEFVRGAESTIYGSDAMTSVVQFFTATGRTRTPELTLGAEGGTFATARGYASIAGAGGPLDYNLFADETHSDGQGINDGYSNSSQGANIGLQLGERMALRLRSRHSNNRSGVQSDWNFNGQPLLTPDSDQRARQNNFLASLDLSLTASARWQHRFTGFEYHHKRRNVDSFSDPGRVSPVFGPLDFPFTDIANINRAGFQYQTEYAPRVWARTVAGYQFEDENGFVGDPTSPPLSHGLRRNHSLYTQQLLSWKRATLVGGIRYVTNESFGNKAVPHASASLLLFRGDELFSGTRLRFAYGAGIKEPRLEESFGSAGGFVIIPNRNLKAEENRSLEAGVEQSFASRRITFSAQYFNNLFRNQIAFKTLPAPPPLFIVGEYVNLNRALAHGVETELQARAAAHLTFAAAYNYTSTQILKAPLAFDPLLAQGRPLLRRPKHSATMTVSYLAQRWSGSLNGVFIGRRTDSDFSGLGVDHAAGYARFDLGGWYKISSHVTAYVNVENVLNRKYEESAGYPALRANFRAGLRFRLGGDR